MDAALILVRLTAFGAGVALFGAPLFVLYAGRPDHITPKLLRLLLIVAAVISALAAGAALILQTGEMAGDPAAGLDPAALRDVVTAGGFGPSVLARIGVALTTLGLMIVRPAGRIPWSLAAALGAVELGALAWAGHGAADEGAAGVAHLLADIAHLLAAGVWLGALLMFALLLSAARAGNSELNALYGALKGFSGVGSIVVVVILATGLINAWFLVGPEHVGGLLASLWGRLLLVKIVLFIVMLGLAATNRFRLTPRLEAVLAADPRLALIALRRSILLENAFGLTVLAVVAALGLQAPPGAS